MSRPLLVTAVLLITAAAGCGGRWNKTAIPAWTPSDILPMAVGSQWGFVDSSFTHDRGLPAGVDSSRAVITANLTVPASGVNVGAFEWTWVDPVTSVPYNWSLLLGTLPNGLYWFGDRYGPALFVWYRSVQYFSPAYLNDQWRSSVVEYDPTRNLYIMAWDSVECTRPAVTFNTPAGPLNCTEYMIRHEYQDASSPFRAHSVRDYQYYAPGVGYAGQVYVLDGVIVFTRRLKYARLAPPGPAPAATAAHVTQLAGPRLTTWR